MKTLRVILIKHAIFAVAAFSLASTLTTRAVTITGFVETQDNLSFNFSGSGGGDYISSSLPALNYWKWDAEGHVGGSGNYGFVFAVKHLPDGPFVHVGNFGPAIPYGTTLSDTKSAAHGTGLDTYNFSITVQSNDGLWAAFSGSFSAIHSGPTSVPDGGSSALLMGLAGLGLVSMRRWLIAA